MTYVIILKYFCLNIKCKKKKTNLIKICKIKKKYLFAYFYKLFQSKRGLFIKMH